MWSQRGVEFYPKEGKTFYVEQDKTFPVEIVVKYELGMNKEAGKKLEEMEKKLGMVQEVEKIQNHRRAKENSRRAKTKNRG